MGNGHFSGFGSSLTPANRATEQRRIGALVTDLVCVHQRMLPVFEGAARMVNLAANFEPAGLS